VPCSAAEKRSAPPSSPRTSMAVTAVTVGTVALVCGGSPGWPSGQARTERNSSREAALMA